MEWIELLSLIACLQIMYFAMAVSKARQIHNLPSPKMAGHEVVERHIRGHANSVEFMVLFLPTLWIAARSWSPYLIAAIGMVYVVGRFIYFQGYVQEAKKRHPGFFISFGALIVLVLLGIAGAIRSLIA